MLPTFARIKPRDGSSHEMGVAPPSSERLAATHRRTQLGYPSFRRTLLIDTRRASPNGRYVMRANSSALTLRSVWQSSLTTLPCSRRSDPAPCSRLNSAIAQPSRDAPRCGRPTWGTTAPKPKPRWDVHLPGAGNRGGSLAGVFRPLIAGPSGSAVSPRLSGWTARPGICRPSPAPPPCCPSTDCQ